MVANELRALQEPLKTAPITSPIPTTIPSSVGRCRYRSRSIAGSDMRLHFDSPPQVRAGINMIYTALLSSVYYAVKAVVDPTILPNSGLARPMTVTAPLGTIMNATHPAAVNGRTTCQRVADLVIGALAQAAPERCIAAGNGSCATASFAGNDRRTDASGSISKRSAGAPARAPKGRARRCPRAHDQHLEPAGRSARSRIPFDLLRYELVDGSGGAGRSRGGMGLRRVYRAEAECHLRLDGSRLLTPPWGLEAGQRGGRGASRFSDAVVPFVNGAGRLRAGERVEIIIPGAGGYGSPVERDSAAIEPELTDKRVDRTTEAGRYPQFRGSA